MDEPQRAGDPRDVAAVEFLLPGRLGDELTATAQERSRSRRTGIYDVEVCNSQGDCIALFRGRSHEVGGSLIDSSAPPISAAARTGGSG
jgi:acyl-CoA thioesterase